MRRFYRTILVREVDPGTFNNPRLDQTGKAYCPNSPVVAADFFGPLTAKVSTPRRSAPAPPP